MKLGSLFLLDYFIFTISQNIIIFALLFCNKINTFIMEKYTKKHISKVALNSHINKIEKRGGKYEVDGFNIKYWFPINKISINPSKNLPISKLDTSFLKKPQNETRLYSMNVVGRGDGEEVVYRKSIGTPTIKEVNKIIKLVTNLKKIEINQINDSYFEIKSASEKVGNIKYKDLSIFSKFVDWEKMKSINSINDFL
jgi:hypothetical protein